jgi:hypothetical protein
MFPNRADDAPSRIAYNLQTVASLSAENDGRHIWPRSGAAEIGFALGPTRGKPDSNKICAVYSLKTSQFWPPRDLLNVGIFGLPP